jgi:hypothetical protein
MINAHVPAVGVSPDHVTSRVASAVPARGGKTAGTLILRHHQPAIPQPRQPTRRPNLNWAGRGGMAMLAALHSLIPAEGPADRPLYVLGVVYEAWRTPEPEVSDAAT